tara:strand:+ start:139 stop:489 length:351 start_codon:yes stop_codon:yes gene_type:complete
MNIEIIKDILDISNDKKNTILFFLKSKDQQKLKNTEYITTNMLYLDNKIYLIKKNTLELKYSGKLEYYKKNKIGIKINNNYNIYIYDIDNYYIFRNKIKNDQTLFYQKLLNQLEDI